MSDYLKITKAAKRLLLDAFPGMRFTVFMENPKYAHGTAYQTIHVEYNADIAKERGITQTAMRETLCPITQHDTIADFSKPLERADQNRLNVSYVTKVVFTKKQSTTPAVNSQKVQDIVDALSYITDETGSWAVYEAIETLADFLPRAQRPLLNAVVAELKKP